MSDKTTTSSGGIGFAGLLTILFIGLKLGHVITWSWFWVLSPLWISVLLAILVIVIIGGGYLLTMFLVGFIGGTIEYFTKKDK